MIYFFITVCLDLFLSTFVSSTYQNISIYFPCVLIGIIPIIYHVFRSKRLFVIVMLILGTFYDLLFSDIFLVNTYYFLLCAVFSYFYFKGHKASFLNIFILSICFTCFYDIFVFFILILTNYSKFTIYELYYKIKNTILINFIYTALVLFLLKSRIFGYKKKKKIYS